MLNSELLKKTTEELKKLEEESRAELFALKFQAAMGNLEKPHRISLLRKQIARILTIISQRRIAGENTQINVKIDLKETYAKIEKESQAFAKERKAKIEKMMADQEVKENDFSSLMDLPLDEAMLGNEASSEAEPVASEAPTEESTTKTAKPATKKPAPKKPVAEKAVAEKAPAPKASSKPAAKPASPATKGDALKSLIAKNEAEKDAKAKATTPKPAKPATVTVKSVTSAKAEIEVEKLAPKTAKGTGEVKAKVEKDAKAKLAEMKSTLAAGTAKGKGTGVKIDISTKQKDPNAKEYTYGANWEENRDKIAKATTKKVSATSETAKKTTAKKGTTK
ncbi:50S ribosomal protein L29 [Spiroplasma eriocheiris]|uniref:Large ribosomal subunit protein uL29 n=1 Tax=Spiroplasma eriocheiris TaxID=315358 RepID=A0A0H3XH28_9MOLU|nr:50S ribosomal protein L29 [Spiroplasma eriocheiris]AHF57422.1 50S ribosomal protein L29 [Spiroplasma eriocheiris CCTCC M 207170]AKM53878.1 50S ribosomal protein L29 [Spiroplasma eriocheiris]